MRTYGLYTLNLIQTRVSATTGCPPTLTRKKNASNDLRNCPNPNPNPRLERSMIILLHISASLAILINNYCGTRMCSLNLSCHTQINFLNSWIWFLFICFFILSYLFFYINFSSIFWSIFIVIKSLVRTWFYNLLISSYQTDLYQMLNVFFSFLVSLISPRQ